MYTIQKHLQYNAWADSKVVEILSNLDEKLFDQPVKSSFPSVRKTICHVWDSAFIWLTRIKGGQVSGWPSENFKGTNQEMIASFAATSKELADLIATKDRAFLDSQIHYKNMKGIEFTQPVEDILFHVVNHNTYHRGQLITIFRELGIETLPNQDLIAYMRLQLPKS
jgi:uncharacterized damage-inducible protein DinB